MTPWQELSLMVQAAFGAGLTVSGGHWALRVVGTILAVFTTLVLFSFWLRH